MTTFNEPQHQSDEAARKWFEALRWPDGVVCPHCGSINRAYARKRPGLYRCAEKECRKDFTVTTKSVLESSHIPLRLWAQAFTLLCSSKKGISAHQVHRTLKITYKSAWFLCHRIREAMRQGGLATLGGEGTSGIVEADETYYGKVEPAKRRATRRDGDAYKTGSRGPANKRPIVALVERGGNVRTFHAPVADQLTVQKIIRENIAREATLHTDESRLYTYVTDHLAAHETVKHSGDEYVRYQDGVAIHTNSAEGYFSIFKRGMRGVYQHCAEKHLHRYLAEYDFRYNHRIKLGYNDGERAALAVKSAAGKRLTYRQSH